MHFIVTKIVTKAEEIEVKIWGVIEGKFELNHKIICTQRFSKGIISVWKLLFTGLKIESPSALF